MRSRQDSSFDGGHLLDSQLRAQACPNAQIPRDFQAIVTVSRISDVGAVTTHHLSIQLLELSVLAEAEVGHVDVDVE